MPVNVAGILRMSSAKVAGTLRVPSAKVAGTLRVPSAMRCYRQAIFWNRRHRADGTRSVGCYFSPIYVAWHRGVSESHTSTTGKPLAVMTW